ncbi:P-loop NTPase fold protein [Myxococcus fulvus]|uniref:P-loop NTPase fold protein n=1 Tax=Myxococcus fulvus TaxID=33 RepID=UPI003B9C3456
MLERMAQAEDESVEGTEGPETFLVRFQDLDTREVSPGFRVTLELGVLLCRALQLAPLLKNRPSTPEELGAVSFSSLMAAFNVVNDPVSRWLIQITNQSGARVSHLVSEMGLTSEQLQHHLFGAPPLSLLEHPLPWTSSARKAFKTAQSFRWTSDANHPESPIDVRHLLAAFLWLESFHDTDFEQLRIHRDGLRQPFIDFVSSLHPDETHHWQMFHFQPQERPPRFPEASPVLSWLGNDQKRTLYTPRYDTDGRENEDLLDIDRDVDALGALIASRTMAPPLSIGVFGEWGSGKSFFMQHLRKRVEVLANQALTSSRSQQEVAFYKNIIQIEFNAWHYSEGNLWASLVEHIFRNLRKNGDESEKDIGKRRDDLLTRLAQREADLLKKQAEVTAKEAEVAQAQQKVGDLEQQKAAKRSDLEQALAEKQSLMTVLPSTLTLDADVKARATQWLEEAGFTAVGRTAFELRDALGNAQAELRRSGGFIASLLDKRGASPRLKAPAIILGVSLLASLGIPFLLSKLGKQDLAGLTAGLTTLTGFVGAAAAWLKKQTDWLRERREQSEARLREVEQAIETEFQRQLKPLEDAARDAKDQVANLSIEEQKQREAQAKAQGEVLQLKQKLAELSNVRLLDKFIENRTGSDDYRKHLGLVALIRRDFEELSRLMEAVNREQHPDPEVPAINRIVLYIDDLDRCSQETVVKVLQAVHLLLAFPLFVVVVGVDSRWVARCLNRTFKDLLQDEADGSKPADPDTLAPGATAYDYLEKIFQIPIWLRPIGEVQRASMLRGLLSRPSSEERASAASVMWPSHQAIFSSHPTEGGSIFPAGSTGNIFDRATHDEHQEALTDEGVHVAAAREEELNPPGLIIGEPELVFIDHLGPLLSSTPRVLKRFANTYRLIKACVPDEGQEEFMREGNPGASPSQVCLMLLALVTSKQELATEFFGLVRLFEKVEPGPTLHELLAPPSEEQDSKCPELFTWMQTLPESFGKTLLSLVHKLVPWVTRFSFR